MCKLAIFISAIFSIFLCGCMEKENVKNQNLSENFVTGAFCGPGLDDLTEENFKNISEAQIDILFFWNNRFYEYNKKVLDLASKYGMKSVPLEEELLESVNNPSKTFDESVVKNTIEKYGDHPALAAYGIKDEPNALQFQRIAEIKNSFSKYDPDTPIFTNLFPGYATGKQLGTFPSKELGTSSYYEYVNKFVEIVKPEILCYDHYPLSESNIVNPGWYDDLKIHREISRKANIPFWLFMQSEGLKGFMRVPNQEEVYWQAFSAMAYGARGILWFTYWNPPLPSELPEELQKIYKDVHYNAMVDTKGNKTNVYYYVLNANKAAKKLGHELNGWDNIYFARYIDGKLVAGTNDGSVVIGADSFDLIIGTFIKRNNRRALIVNDDLENDTMFQLNSGKIIWLNNCKSIKDQKIYNITLNPGGALLLEF